MSAPGASLLLVEDDPAGRDLASYNLRKAGYSVAVAGDGLEGLQRFDPQTHAVVITDLRMPKLDGLSLLQKIHGRSPATPVLVITAYGDVDVAVTAMKAGAFDFIGKPFNKDHLLLTVARAFEQSSLRDQVSSLKRQLRDLERPIVAESSAMARVLRMTDRVAASEASIVVTGESGTGKELIARRLHARSQRAEGPFVAINCAAIPDNLLEAELFGHERGAFTGAGKARVGRFRRATGGTLFLDEIGALPLELQGKLLRVLQERVVDVVGRDTPESVDVRIVAATNKDLRELARWGKFREDLMYRLNVVEIELPPLRDRREDILPLAHHFVKRFAGGEPLSLSAEAETELASRDWPGNVRQLQNACERLVLLAEGQELSADDLPPPERAGEPPEQGTLLDDWPRLPADGLSLMDLEKRVIEKVLGLKKGNVSQAAAYLRIPRHVLSYRMAKYGIRRPT